MDVSYMDSKAERVLKNGGNVYVMLRLNNLESWYFVANSDDDAIASAQLYVDGNGSEVKVSRLWVMDQPLGDVREEIATVRPEF